MADRTIGELAEAPIGSLPSIAGLYDDSLLAVEQQGEARKMTGAQWKEYARAGVSAYVESAKEAANAAEQSAAAAESSAHTAQQYSGKPPVIQAGYWWTWDADRQKYVSTGKRSVLNFDKVYASVAAMNADKANAGEMDTAIISSTVDDPANAAIYIFDGKNWNFLADLSGFTGIGIQSITLTSGDHSPGAADVYTILCTDGSSYTFSVRNGPAGPKGDAGEPFKILGRYDTLDALIASRPAGNDGDAWAVGTAEDNTTYVWDVDKAAWVDIGKISGKPGKSAYQYAVDGGYTGTEEEFQQLMGTGPWLPTKGGTLTGNVILAANKGLQFKYRTAWQSSDSYSLFYPGDIDMGGADGDDAVLTTGTAGLITNGLLKCFGLSVGNDRIAFVASPIYDTDAANKQYVDDAVANAGQSGGPFLPLGGGTISGPIKTILINAFVSSGLGAYVSSTVKDRVPTICTGTSIPGSEYSPGFGFQVSGDHNGSRLQGISDPVYAHDAANKAYVDGLIGNIADALDSINGEAV